MRGFLTAITTTVLFAAITNAAWADPQEKVLHNFNNVSGEGYNPYAALTFDDSGNLYGTTLNNGTYNGCGPVFELMPEPGGGWKEKVLHQFDCEYGKADGDGPYGGVIFDSSGNLWGTTADGGDDRCRQGGCGMVFGLIPNGAGGWTETRDDFDHFSYNDIGIYPASGLIFSDGTLYGTTAAGGDYLYGTVFEAPAQSCQYCIDTLYSFDPNGNDGLGPYSGLVFDTKGNLYGTTNGGGASSLGTVFELINNGFYSWTETVIHSFGNYDGAGPQASLVFDPSGNLYGTTVAGGYGKGTVFELSPGTDGTWTQTVLFSFNGTDGMSPYSTLIFDSQGNLHGTTFSGGKFGLGTAFELMPRTDGTWTERFYSFNGKNGANPYAGLVFDSKGDLYGTTYHGGTHNYGSVF